jgi:SAM-dependent methyltransferase
LTGLQELRRVAYYRVYGADGFLGRALKPGMRVLDVGCSDGRGSEVLSSAGVHGVDIYRPALEAARGGQRRGPVAQGDVRALPFGAGTFDVVVSLDVVEHFDKPDARRVLDEMERVVVTPRGYVPQPGTRDEPWQEHKCGFEADELEALGYEVSGIGGPARWRGPYGTFRGGVFGQAAAAACIPTTKHRPELAFALLGVKGVVPGNGPCP